MFFSISINNITAQEYLNTFLQLHRTDQRWKVVQWMYVWQCVELNASRFEENRLDGESRLSRVGSRLPLSQFHFASQKVHQASNCRAETSCRPVWQVRWLGMLLSGGIKPGKFVFYSISFYVVLTWKFQQ